MNRRDFLKSLMALPSFAFLKPIFGKTTGISEVAGFGFAPNVVLYHSDGRVIAFGDNGQTFDGYPLEGLIDIESFDENGVTITDGDESIVFTYPDADIPIATIHKDGFTLFWG